MTKQQIEAWAIRIIEQVKSKQANEDAFVELKSEWPSDFPKVAQRIAGHANAAHGEPILWLIGVDEKSGPVAATPVNMADWLPSLYAQFIELPPTITDLNVPYNGVTVVALLIETDRAPYVVKNAVHGQQGGGSVECEIPWRSGTSVRSAKRSDLLKILVPRQRLPQIEILSGGIILWDKNAQGYAPEGYAPDAHMHWTLEFVAYVTPPSSERVVLPLHRMKCQIEVEEQREAIPLTISVKDTYRDAGHIKCTLTEAIIDGPGAIMLVGSQGDLARGMPLDRPIRCTMSIFPTLSELPVTIDKQLHYKRGYSHPSVSGPHPHAKISSSWSLGSTS